MKEKEGNWKGGQNSEGRKNEKERKKRRALWKR